MLLSEKHIGKMIEFKDIIDCPSETHLSIQPSMIQIMQGQSIIDCVDTEDNTFTVMGAPFWFEGGWIERIGE